jgi:hypothetical protein
MELLHPVYFVSFHKEDQIKSCQCSYPARLTLSLNSLQEKGSFFDLQHPVLYPALPHPLVVLPALGHIALNFLDNASGMQAADGPVNPKTFSQYTGDPPCDGCHTLKV